jgi:hypothetical protein
MAITAQSIVSAAGITLQDPSVRWPATELIGYMNEGIRALIIARPDALTKKSAFVPVPGSRQTLPAEVVAFIDIIGNTSGNERQVTKVDVGLLSAINRDWQSSRASASVRHFTYDPRDPYCFYVFPPSTGSGSIDLLYSYFPADLATVVDVSPLHIQWFSVILNFVLAKAFSKDAEFGGNAASAAAYMGAFNAGIGSQLQSSTTVSPKS